MGKTIDQKIDELALAVARGFQEVHERIDGVKESLTQKIDTVHSDLGERLDKIDGKVTGLSGRVDVLEDQMRVVKTKLNLT